MGSCWRSYQSGGDYDMWSIHYDGAVLVAGGFAVAGQRNVTPATITNLVAGEHTYRLALPGYNDASGKFMIEAGKTTPVSVTLKKTTWTGAALLAVVALGAGIAVLAAAIGN